MRFPPLVGSTSAQFNYSAAVQRMPWKNISFAAGWSEFLTHLGVDSDRFDGRRNWRYGGLRIYARAAF